MWGLTMTYHLTSPLLRHTDIKAKFVCLQLVNVCQNLQSFLFNVLVMAGVIRCDNRSNLSVEAVAQSKIEYHYTNIECD